ncbi:PREDICTED: ZP domain-containing protein-like [Branchiostoma belcheri]|uniref:ZP domain-containing protein-like n=1 Tax=Branchiostoma belcheri TaxID=7741 RepID=A0A6P4YUJ4_BRABE|nr:PREDICTED: ZP domain-containing protein-like [Branchiostoma belcheri]
MPKNSAINTFIHNLARDGIRWIGLNDIDNEGQWVFEDSQTLASSGYANWAPGEPNDSGGAEDCALVFGSTHTWNDGPCTVSTVAFICQLGPGTTSATVTSLPTTKYTFTLTSFDEDDEINREIGGTYATFPAAELSGLTLDDAGIGHLTVSWTVVGNLPISRYSLSYQPADGSGSYQDLSPAPGPDATSATVPGLLADTEYTLTLTSFDEDDQPNGEISGTYTTDSFVVNVVCDQDSMSLSIPRAALPAVNVENLHLLDPDCGATEDEDEDVFKLETHLQECGTRQETSGDDKFIFSNEVIANQVTQANGAVRNQPVNLPFQCEFLRQHVVSQGNDIMYNIPSPRLQIIDANNSFTMEMHMYTSEDFSATYKSSDFPLQVSPSDRLHFGLSVASSLDNLELFARDCVSTPTTDPDDSPRVSIIADGCRVDETLQKDNDLSNDKALYYSVAAFTFPNALDPSLVYFHCTMMICFKDDPDSRCKQGCIPPARRRRAVSDGTEGRVRRESSRDKQADITQGPFQVQSGEAGTGPAGVPLGTAVGAAVGVAGIMVLLIVAGVLAKKRGGKKKRDDDTVGLDNYAFQSWGNMSKTGIADTKA